MGEKLFVSHAQSEKSDNVSGLQKAGNGKKKKGWLIAVHILKSWKVGTTSPQCGAPTVAARDMPSKGGEGAGQLGQYGHRAECGRGYCHMSVLRIKRYISIAIMRH